MTGQDNKRDFMPKNNIAVCYRRSPDSRNKSVPYEQKFANLIKLCRAAKNRQVRNIIIAWPWVIGDTYEEVIESLSHFSEAGLVLHIVERGDDEHLSIPGVANN